MFIKKLNDQFCEVIHDGETYTIQKRKDAVTYELCLYALQLGCKRDNKAFFKLVQENTALRQKLEICACKEDRNIKGGMGAIK